MLVDNTVTPGNVATVDAGVLGTHERQGRNRGLGFGTPSQPAPGTRRKIIRPDLHPNSSREEKNR